MKKGIILLALIFTACINLDNIGGNSGGEVKEVKTTNISTSKNYEKRNGSLYVDNVLANGKQEYKEKNGVIIKGNYKDGLADGEVPVFFACKNHKLFLFWSVLASHSMS